MPGRDEIESARWAFGRIPASVELKWAAARGRAAIMIWPPNCSTASGLITAKPPDGSRGGPVRRSLVIEAYDRAEGLFASCERYPPATADIALDAFCSIAVELNEAEAIVETAFWRRTAI
ncbi:MAG: hypothetical protein R2843_06350 [Thermomicrobiales bacterium]